MKILDSDHCVAILRGKLELPRKMISLGPLATTSISVGELVLGAQKSMKPAEGLEKVDILLREFIILPFDEACARRYGALRAALEVAGRRLDDLDLQIASIAVHHRIPLVTHNRRHFARVPGLVLEDWLS